MLPQLEEAAKKRMGMRCQEKKNLQRGRKIRGGGGSLEQSWDGIRPGEQATQKGLRFFSMAQIALICG
jgi:hypothetical protein